MVLITERERNIVYQNDLELIDQYLIKRFNLQEEELTWKGNGLRLVYIIYPKDMDLTSQGFDTLNEIRRFNSEMWDKLQLYTIRHFNVIGGKKITASIDYKANVEVKQLNGYFFERVS
jgi:hypothetical protein